MTNVPGQGVGRTEWASLDRIIRQGLSEGMTHKFRWEKS